MQTFKLKKCKRIHGLHFTPKGGKLLVVGASIVEVVETAILLDVATGEVIRRIELDGGRYAVPPDVARLATLQVYPDDDVAPVQCTSLAGEEADWHVVKGSEKLVPEDGNLHGIAFDGTGEVLAIGHDLEDDKNGVTLLRLDSGKAIGKRAYSEYPGVLAFNSNASLLAVKGGSPEVSVFRLPSLKPLFSYKPPGTRTRCLRFLPDGRLIAGNARNVYVFPPDGVSRSWYSAGIWDKSTLLRSHPTVNAC